MTHDLKALRELEKRLAAAKGPSREIDAAIFNALPFGDGGFQAYKEDNCVTLEAWGFEPRYFDGWVIRRTTVLEDHYPDRLDKFTASLDAAVSLVERVLPDYRWIVDKDCDRAPRYAAQVKERGATWKETPRPFADTPALALCLACIRALISQGEQ